MGELNEDHHTEFMRDDHPTLPPTDESGDRIWFFPSLDTEHLRRLRAQLRTNIPGDPTHAAAVATLLGALVDQEIGNRPPPVATRAVPAGFEPTPEQDHEDAAAG